jgi:hypothetical protein
METAGVEPAPSRCKREVLSQSASPYVAQDRNPLARVSGRAKIPEAGRFATGSRRFCVRLTECGRVESNHHSLRRRGYSAESSPRAQRPHG